jgi:hypothetical protein
MGFFIRGTADVAIALRVLAFVALVGDEDRFGLFYRTEAHPEQAEAAVLLVVGVTVVVFFYHRFQSVSLRDASAESRTGLVKASPGT